MLLGIEALVANPPAWFRNARLGLVVNQASVDSRLLDTPELVARNGGRITCLFSPQHGYCAEKQANMIESDHSRDPVLGVPIHSLYGETRQPTGDMLRDVDVLVIDLQDVGTRVYTYAMTMGLCMEAAAAAGVKVVIADRPNPIGGLLVEGKMVDADCRSFVGRYPVPMRHGLTMGEYARFIAGHCGVSADLEVAAMEGWKRAVLFPETGLSWVFPSPNMPSWETALLYPGMVLLEGVNVSEGRGTTLPFHLVGAPFLDGRRLAEHLNRLGLDGVWFRPVCFEPVFDKWRGELCSGVQIHVRDPLSFRPFQAGIAVLGALWEMAPDQVEWLPPPYEYEYEKFPIDILLGNTALKDRIREGGHPLELEKDWRSELDVYLEARKDCLIYR